MTRIIRSERGSILVITLLILFAVSAIGATLASISSTDLRIAGNQRSDTRALTVAEAGLQEAIHRIAVPNPTTATVGGWTGNIAISDSEPYDPDWETHIFLTSPGSAPIAGGGVISTGTIQDPGQTYLEYTEPSGNTGVLSIQHKWRDRDSDGNRDANEIVLYDSEKIPPENFNSGFPVEIVTVTGRAGRANRTIEAEVTKRTVSARTLGALYTDHAIDITGSPVFCGYDHDINIPDETVPNACFAYHLSSGHLPGVTTTGDDVSVSGSAADLLGQPAPVDTASANPWYTLADVLGLAPNEVTQILNNADNTSIVNPLDGITYINGDATINSNVVGSGLIYITGDAYINGDFVYKGLIYVEGDMDITGTPWILGSMIVKGTTDYSFGAGSAGVLYSKEAIQKYIGRSMPGLVLSWREM